MMMLMSTMLIMMIVVKDNNIRSFALACPYTYEKTRCKTERERELSNGYIFRRVCLFHMGCIEMWW